MYKQKGILLLATLTLSSHRTFLALGGRRERRIRRGSEDVRIDMSPLRSVSVGDDVT